MDLKRKLALISATTLLAFSCSVVHADSTKLAEIQSRIAQITKEIEELDQIGVSKYGLVRGTDAYVGNLEGRIEKLEKLLNNPNKGKVKSNITVSPTYAKALKADYDFSLPEKERDTYEEILKAESKKVKQALLDSFVSDPFDEQVTYDVNNLPREVLVELNYYALDLMNQVRKQMNLPQVRLSDSSIDFAYKVSQKVIKANRSISDWHYVKGINEVAREYGLRTSSKEEEQKANGGQYYENAVGVYNLSGQVTIGKLKKEIYTGIVRFLYDGSEFLHAQSIAGVRWGEPSELEYFGVSAHRLKDGVEFSFILVPLEYVNKSTKQNFKTEAPVDTTASNRSKVVEQQNKLLQSYKSELVEAKKVHEKRQKLYMERLGLYDKEEEERFKEERSKPQPTPILNGWQKEGNFWYFYKNNQPLKNTWQGDYWLGSDGKMVTNAWVDNGRYYVDGSGKYVPNKKPQQNKPVQNQDKPSSKPVSKKNGWVKEGSAWYFYKNDNRVKNAWQGSYYLKSDGRMAEAEWVYDPSYKAWYYLKSNGIYARDSWQGSYYLKSNGKMAEGEWIYDSSYKAWFYLKAGGAYANSQWFKVDGSWYYFKSGGYMARNVWQGSYYLKSSGAMAVNEWIYDSYWSGWYYLKADGSYARNEVVQGRYRVNASGKWI